MTVLERVAEKKFVFVSGLHRSGTSIMFKSIREHPMVSGFVDTGSPENEGMHLQTVYPTSLVYGGAGQFAYHPDAYLREDSPLVTEENREKLLAEWAQYWDMSKPVLLEKSPPNLIRTRFLQAMFPNTYFVVFLRHPLAVGYATRRWSNRLNIPTVRLRRILKHWIIAHEAFLEDTRHLENYLIVKYESFVSDPDNELRRIYDFIDIPPQESKLEVRTGVNDKYLAKWHRRATPPLTPVMTGLLIQDFEARINRFGYSLVDLDRNDPVQM